MFVCPECGTALHAPGACPTDGTTLAPIGEDVLLGTTIGVYRVACLLGIGGMGRVYKGVHPGIGSRVAIKVLSRECSDRPDLVDRFFAEARAVNLIRHESIVNVLDLSRLPDGRPYIIMEYLDGAPLSALIQQSTAQRVRLPLGGVARLAAEVLDALAAAHAKGIIHRDLKPDNIYVTPSGRAKVLDFGIAKLTETTGTATQTGSLLGTPQYMSPEQAQGKPVDQRADLYAMGVILFECVTNTRPFEAESLFDLLRHQIDSPPPPPRSRRPDLPPDYEAVILASLAKSPDHRFANAEAMSVALQQASAQLAPDQWAPLVGGTRSGPAGWSPTPPASWSRSGARAPSMSPGLATEPSGPPTGARPASSKKGLVLGIVAVAVIGGAVAAALVLGGGSDDKPVVVVAAGVASAAPDAGSATVAQPDATAAKAAAPMGSDDDAADDDSDDLEAVAAALATDPDDDAKVASLRKRALAMIAKLPPDKRAEYQKLLELEKSTGTAPEPGTGTGTGTGTGKGTGKGKGTGTGWVTAHELAYAFDPHRVDVGTYLAWAIAQGKAAVPDAVLTRVELEGVRPDGTADLTLPIGAQDHGEIALRFVSPSRAKRDPSIPVGVHVDWQCQFRVEASPKQIELRPLDGWECKEEIVPTPRCTAAALWKKAVAKKPALAGLNAIAAMSFYMPFKGDKAYWYFSIQDTFSERFDDDCH